MAEGIFGNRPWLTSDKKKGTANPQFWTLFCPSEMMVGINVVSEETTDTTRPITVYTSTGILLHRDATPEDIRHLPSCLYNIQGR